MTKYRDLVCDAKVLHNGVDIWDAVDDAQDAKREDEGLPEGAFVSSP